MSAPIPTSVRKADGCRWGAGCVMCLRLSVWNGGRLVGGRVGARAFYHYASACGGIRSPVNGGGRRGRGVQHEGWGKAKQVKDCPSPQHSIMLGEVENLPSFEFWAPFLAYHLLGSLASSCAAQRGNYFTFQLPTSFPFQKQCSCYNFL